MTPDPVGVSRQLRRLATAVPDDATDGQLLDRYLADRDEASFARLVRRHGGMVLAVCRRVAGNHADADDAFQAAFVVLVRRAAGLTARVTVGDWLYGVALRTALKARTSAARRRAKEAAAAKPEAAPDRTATADLAEVIDRELARLPARLREVIVLCDLEDRPRREVAEQLGIPKGTLSSRLTHARKALAERLRGLATVPAAGLLPAVAPARPADALEAEAVRAAGGAASPAVTKLVTEVTTAMFLSKARIGVAALAAVVLAAGVGLAARSARDPANPGSPAKPAVARPAAVADDLKDLTDKWQAEHKAIEGTWEFQKQVVDDKEQENQFEYLRWTFTGRDVKIEHKVKGDEKFEGESSFIVNPTTSPPEMQHYGKGFLVMAIYELKGDTLKVAAHGISELERPRSFAAGEKRIPDLPLIVWEFKRKK